MKVLIAFCLSISTNFLFAHDYIKTVVEGKEWDVVKPMGLGTYQYYNYRLACDTTINFLEYKMVRSRDADIIYGYAREDTVAQKVYYITKDSAVEILIADYSLHQNDTFTWQGGFKASVDSVFDSIVFGQTRKIIFFNQELKFIEGIGHSFFGILPLTNFAYITNVQSTAITCNALTFLSVHNNLYLKISPNIVTDDLHINDFEAVKNKSFKIVNIYGQILFDGQLSRDVIDVSSLSKGNYYLSVNSENDLFSFKFIKQ
ncbi:MAG: C-terminal target protein [Bacteroidota bacterium]|nr:C-terminal target protein [Bacteroidota bacterium]